MTLWRFILLILVALITACQPAYINGVPNERSPYLKVPVNSILTLNRAIRIQPAQDTAYFQRGRMIPWQNVELYDAYCALSLERQLDVEQTVKPGEFLVHTVSNESFFSIVKERRQHGVPVTFKMEVVEMKDGGGVYEVYATVMELRSNTHPEVRRLTCVDWGVPQGMYPPTVEIIRQSLGDFFTLELAL